MKSLTIVVAFLMTLALISGCSSNQIKTQATQTHKNTNKSNSIVKPTASLINKEVNKNSNGGQKNTLHNPYLKIGSSDKFGAGDAFTSGKAGLRSDGQSVRLIATKETTDGKKFFYYLAQFENDPTPAYCVSIFVGGEYQGFVKYAQDIVHNDQYEMVGQSGDHIYYEKFYDSREHPEKGYDLYAAKISSNDHDDVYEVTITNKKKLLSVKSPSTSTYASDPGVNFLPLKCLNR